MTKKQKITAVLALAFAFSLGMAVMCGCSYFTCSSRARNRLWSRHGGNVRMLLLHPGKGCRNPQNGRDHSGYRLHLRRSCSCRTEDRPARRRLADGKITPQQGEMLKEAARKSYEALQAKLTELSVKDVTIEVSE